MTKKLGGPHLLQLEILPFRILFMEILPLVRNKLDNSFEVFSLWLLHFIA